MMQIRRSHDPSMVFRHELASVGIGSEKPKKVSARWIVRMLRSFFVKMLRVVLQSCRNCWIFPTYYGIIIKLNEKTI